MTQEEESQFRKVPIDPNKRGIKKKLSMVQSFAVALASRGMSNRKINAPIKQLRVLSCFGNQEQGGILPPCEHLQTSAIDKSKNICGACGCGDRPNTWLVQHSDEYGKLDYPQLACPLNMPGFTNYLVSSSDEAEEPVTRKYYIENIEYTDVQRTPVTIGEEPDTPPDMPPNAENLEESPKTES